MNPRIFNNLPLADLSDGKQTSYANRDQLRLMTLNLLLTIGIMVVTTLLSFVFKHVDFHESNIIMIYILGVLLVAKQTASYFSSILAAVIGVLAFDYLFTEPYYSFDSYRPDYPITFVIMLIVAITTSTLTLKAKHESMLASLREKRTQLLYQINKGLLKIRSLNQITEIGAKDIAMLFNRSVVMVTVDAAEKLGEPFIYPFANDSRADIFKAYVEMQALAAAFASGNPVGAGTDSFADNAAYYLPIKGPSGILGVVGVSCFDRQLLSDEQKSVLEAAATQITLTIERELLWERQKKTKIDMERERLRANLLRAISHDLRTPLTGILGATATILDNDDVLDKTVKQELLQNIYKDASWLIHAVENILSITRIDDGMIEVRKNMEAIEEIVAEAVSRVKKLASNHAIKINIPEEFIMFPMDGTLIEQVLVNLLDNAIKYTPYGSTIEIRAQLEDQNMVFEVSDNGNGIPQESIPAIFDRFYAVGKTNDTGRRGTGLGLAICKSIVTAHGGEITAFNNAAGGATFKFVLPGKG